MTQSKPRTSCSDLMPEHGAIRKALVGSVRLTLEKDWDLVALGCHEQAIAHRIAVYLERRFKAYSTDCEYNRKEHLIKKYKSGRSKLVPMRPDILVHKRSKPINVLAVEMKANANRKSKSDRAKLKALLGDDAYRYTSAAFIDVLNSTRDIKEGLLRAEVHWYEFDFERERLCSGNVDTITVSKHVPEVLKIYQTRNQQ